MLHELRTQIGEFLFLTQATPPTHPLTQTGTPLFLLFNHM